MPQASSRKRKICDDNDAPAAKRERAWAKASNAELIIILSSIGSLAEDGIETGLSLAESGTGTGPSRSEGDTETGPLLVESVTENGPQEAKSWGTILKMSSKKDDMHLRGYYRGVSRTTKWRKETEAKKFEASTKSSCRKLSDFFQTTVSTNQQLDAAKPYQDCQAEGEVQKQEQEYDGEQEEQQREEPQYDEEQEDEEEKDNDDDDDWKPENKDSADEDDVVLTGDHGKELLDELEAHLKKKKILQSISEEEREKLNAVRFYLRGLQANYNPFWLRKCLAELHGKSHRFANKIETWAVEFKRNGAISRSQRGRHPKRRKLLLNEEVRMKIREWLYSDIKPEVTPQLLLDQLNDDILRPFK
ncbi:hypothetical protein BGZ65_012069, partial [Modicella reniformis]